MPEKTIYKQTPTTYTPVRVCRSMVFGNTPCSVLFATRYNSGGHTRTTQTQTAKKKERRGPGDVSSFSLTLTLSCARVLGEVIFFACSHLLSCAVFEPEPEPETAEPSEGTTPHALADRGGAFELMKARMSSTAASYSAPAAHTAWTEPELRTTHKS